MEIFETINWPIIAPLFVIQAILIIIALVDWVKAEKFNGPKILWLFIILFINILGPIIYFIVGKKRD